MHTLLLYGDCEVLWDKVAINLVRLGVIVVGS